MRVCLVYDHLYPATIGGAEKWMHGLATGLAAAGHDVTYLTLRHWEGAPPAPEGVRVLGLAPAGRVYGSARRSLLPPVRFGWAVARHLARHGRAYDVVHTASFPYFPLLAIGAARRRGGYAVVVDWHEVWTRAYWRRYAGRLGGPVGWAVQRACVRVPQRAFCMSRLHAERLVAEGFRGTPVLLPGLYDGPVEPSPGPVVEPLVVYAGRHIPEKRLPELVRAFGEARRALPELRLEIFGDGSQTGHVDGVVRSLGLAPCVTLRGRRPEDEVVSALARAACVATASEREGYGLLVVEAAARGTPSVVVAGPENAATELVSPGVNGEVAPSASPADLSAAILRAVRGGQALRDSTIAWFEENAPRLRLAESLRVVLATYGDARAGDAQPAPG